MKEKPILFSGPMIWAILANTKTQTRRAVKLKPHQQIEERDDGAPWPWMYDNERDADAWLACPYGQPGDRLWVREMWMYGQGSVPIYRADAPTKPEGQAWRSSIHIPRAASRITLEVTSVRVERLHDISESDCWAEGIEEVMYDFDDAAQIDMANRLGCCIEDAKPLYAMLWERINGKGSWDANPWVWVVEHKRIAQEECAA